MNDVETREFHKYQSEKVQVSYRNKRSGQKTDHSFYTKSMTTSGCFALSKAAAESNREKRSIESSQLERHQLKLNRVPRSVLPDGCFLITLPAAGDEHC